MAPESLATAATPGAMSLVRTVASIRWVSCDSKVLLVGPVRDEARPVFAPASPGRMHRGAPSWCGDRRRRAWLGHHEERASRAEFLDCRRGVVAAVPGGGLRQQTVEANRPDRVVTAGRRRVIGKSHRASYATTRPSRNIQDLWMAGRSVPSGHRLGLVSPLLIVGVGRFWANCWGARGRSPRPARRSKDKARPSRPPSMLQQPCSDHWNWPTTCCSPRIFGSRGNDCRSPRTHRRRRTSRRSVRPEPRVDVASLLGGTWSHRTSGGREAQNSDRTPGRRSSRCRRARGSHGYLELASLDEHSVVELCPGTDQGDEVRGVHRPPTGLGGLDQLEGHSEPCRPRSRSLGPQAHRGEGGLDWWSSSGPSVLLGSRRRRAARPACR